MGSKLRQKGHPLLLLLEASCRRDSCTSTPSVILFLLLSSHGECCIVHTRPIWLSLQSQKLKAHRWNCCSCSQHYMNVQIRKSKFAPCAGAGAATWWGWHKLHAGKSLITVTTLLPLPRPAYWLCQTTFYATWDKSRHWPEVPEHSRYFIVVRVTGHHSLVSHGPQGLPQYNKVGEVIANTPDRGNRLVLVLL